MKKTITICTCDICGKEMEHENSNYLKWHFTAKDYLGNGCADGGEAYHDICDKCIGKLDKSICETIEQIRIAELSNKLEKGTKDEKLDEVS